MIAHIQGFVDFLSDEFDVEYIAFCVCADES
jgi:hypothetical protein